MRSDDVIKRAHAKLTELGVPTRVSHVRKVSSKVVVQVIIRDSLWSLDLRSGITEPELEHKLNHLAGVWEHSSSSRQADLEDAIKAKE